MSNFVDIWNAFHFGNPPVSYLLRQVEWARWVRFHSLPNGKRYATTDAERSEVLRRSNALAERLLSENGDAWLVQALPALYEHRCPVIHEFRLQPVQQFTADETDWRIFTGECRWRSGKFDALLTQVAEDEAHYVLWMSPKNGAIFAPYDGGTDLYLPSADDTELMKAEHAEWLSDRADGL